VTKKLISFFHDTPPEKNKKISNFYGIEEVSWEKERKKMRGILKNRTLTPIRVLFFKKHLTNFYTL